MWGTGQLAEKIARMQSSRIDECLPRIQDAVSAKLAAVRADLAALSPELESEEERSRFLNNVLRNVCGDFERRVRAEFMSSDAAEKKYAVAPRVADIIKEFGDNLRRRNPDWITKAMIQ